MQRGGADPRLPLRYIPKQGQIKVTFEKGVYEDLPESMVPGGYAVSLQNWEPNDAGGLRAKVAFTRSYNKEGGHTWTTPGGVNFDSIFGVARQTRAVYLAPLLGPLNAHYYCVGIKNPQSSYNGSQAGESNEIWVMDTGSTDTSAGGIYGGQHPAGTGGQGWFPLRAWYPGAGDIMAGHSCDFDSAPPSFARFNNHLFYTHPEAFSMYRWDGTVPEAPGGTDRMDSGTGSWAGDDTHGGRCLNVFKDRLIVGGQDPGQGPAYRLYYSAPGDETKWPANNFLDVGKEDEWAIEDTALFDERLIIGKISGIHILTGGGPSTFQLQTIKGMQACQGRSLVATPYGMCILGDSDIWMWGGGTPESIRDGVRIQYAAGSNDWRTAAYCDGKIVIQQHAEPNVLLIYDPVAKRWWTEDVNFQGGVGCVGAWNQRLMVGPFNDGDQANVSWLAARDWPADPREPDGFHLNLPQHYQARASMLAPNQEGLTSPRNFYVRIRQRGVGGDGLTVSLLIDGVVVHSAVVPPATTEGLIWERLDLPSTGQMFSIEFDQQVIGTDAVYDIEDVLPVFDTSPLR